MDLATMDKVVRIVKDYAAIGNLLFRWTRGEITAEVAMTQLRYIYLESESKGGSV